MRNNNQSNRLIKWIVIVGDFIVLNTILVAFSFLHWRMVMWEDITAWETGNIEWLGSLSKASCESSIHNYECGSPELIAIYNAMLTTDGVYVGRFSGAGLMVNGEWQCSKDKTRTYSEVLIQTSKDTKETKSCR